MVHTGALVAEIVGHLPRIPKLFHNDSLKSFRNDHRKRDLLSAGVAAGVSAAFASPIGGVLFSLEGASSFWTFSLTSRVFFCSLCSTYTYNFLFMIIQGEASAGLITFGEFPSNSYATWELVVFILLGIVGGLLGSIWNKINFSIANIRKRYLNKKYLKLLEVVIVIVITASCEFWFPFLFRNHCEKIPENIEGGNYERFNCEEGYYNPFASLMFTTLENSIKALFHNETLVNQWPIILYFLVIFTLAAITYIFFINFSNINYLFGISVPNGIFAPSILMGSSLGLLCCKIVKLIYPDATIYPGSYALIGAASILGGITRMTISLTVILLETTNNMHFLLPLMLVLTITKWIGDTFTMSIYDGYIELKNIPFINQNPPQITHKLLAKNIMTKEVISFYEVESVRTLYSTLLTRNFSGYPVVDKSNHCLGVVTRNNIAVLLNKRIFVNLREIVDNPKVPSNLSYYDFTTTLSSKMIPLNEIKENSKDMFSFVDLRLIYNRATITSNENACLTKIYKLCILILYIDRSLGIRNLPIVNNENQLVGIICRKELQTNFWGIYVNTKNKTS